jgi:ubiquinone/menaquinone biosynthesis C-methylase UbiE
MNSSTNEVVRTLKSLTGMQITVLPPILPNARRRAGRQDERSFAVSLLKYPGELVLDVGTGDCACIASILASQRTPVLAIDRDKRTIGAARKFLDTQHVKEGVRLLQDDITASSLPSDSFRNIVCFNVLHHVPQFDGALAELRRILAPDGRLIISDFDENRDGFLGRLEQAVNRRFRSVTRYHRWRGRLVLSCEK